MLLKIPSSVAGSITFALAVAALPDCVSASPQGEQPYGTISLPDRTLLLNADGTFNHDKAVVFNAATALKYRRNLMNFQENSGGSLPAVRDFISFLGMSNNINTALGYEADRYPTAGPNASSRAA